MPQIRAFRALRFDLEVVGDLSRVVCPPYDVIGPDLHQILLARHPANAVRLDLPEIQAGEVRSHQLLFSWICLLRSACRCCSSFNVFILGWNSP